MTPVVRRLEAAHVGAYRAVRLAGLADSPHAFGSSYEEESIQPDDFFLARIAEPSPAAVFGAFAGDTMVGTARFTVETGQRRQHVGWMTGISVLPPYRRNGIATALVRRVVEHARGACRVLRTAVAVANPGAHAIYVRAGFVPYGTEPRALFAGGDYFDEVLLTLDVDRLPPLSS